MGKTQSPKKINVREKEPENKKAKTMESGLYRQSKTAKKYVSGLGFTQCELDP